MSVLIVSLQTYLVTSGCEAFSPFPPCVLVSSMLWPNIAIWGWKHHHSSAVIYQTSTASICHLLFRLSAQILMQLAAGCSVTGPHGRDRLAKWTSRGGRWRLPSLSFFVSSPPLPAASTTTFVVLFPGMLKGFGVLIIGVSEYCSHSAWAQKLNTFYLGTGQGWIFI